MRRLKFVLIAVAAILTTTGGNLVLANPQHVFPESPGIHDLEISLGDTSLRVTVNVPPPRTSGMPPLIVILHYGGPPSGYYGRGLIEQLMGPAFTSLDGVMIAPVSLGGDWTHADNENAVLELIKVVEKFYGTDPNRRVITGYSLGGAGTWFMLEKHASLFAAAIPVSGFRHWAATSCDTPIYAVHSTVDAIFDVKAVTEQIARLRESGCQAEVELVDGVDHFNVPAFGNALSNAVRWIEERWSD